jgi:hypothetical protein
MRMAGDNNTTKWKHSKMNMPAIMDVRTSPSSHAKNVEAGVCNQVVHIHFLSVTLFHSKTFHTLSSAAYPELPKTVVFSSLK